MEINLYQEEEKAFVSDGMSQYIYTDMAPELHIKNKSLNIGKYTSKSTASNREQRRAAGCTVDTRRTDELGRERDASGVSCSCKRTSSRRNYSFLFTVFCSLLHSRFQIKMESVLLP